MWSGGEVRRDAERETQSRGDTRTWGILGSERAELEVGVVALNPSHVGVPGCSRVGVEHGGLHTGDEAKKDADQKVLARTPSTFHHLPKKAILSVVGVGVEHHEGVAVDRDGVAAAQVHRVPERLDVARVAVGRVPRLELRVRRRPRPIDERARRRLRGAELPLRTWLPLSSRPHNTQGEGFSGGLELTGVTSGRSCSR